MNADLEPTKTGKLIHNSLTHTHTYARTQILNFKMLKQYSLQLKKTLKNKILIIKKVRPLIPPF